MSKIAINGFGRIGRLFFRQVFDKKEFEIVAINDHGNHEKIAYLLKYDSVYGRWDKGVETKGDELIVDGRKIKVLQEKDPAALPWKDLGIDVAVESTGFFESYEKAKAHLSAGAKRVVITAPAKDADGPDGMTVLMGVNEDGMQSCQITSNGSCTTNSAAPVMQVLSENPGIVKAVLNTVHAMTASQSLTDSPAKGSDFRKARAAPYNIVPSTTGAAIAVTRVVKDLEGKFDGMAMRVPVISGSIADITFLAKRKVTAEEINDILRKAAAELRWQGILKVSDDPLVSSDILNEHYGAIVDSAFTKVVDGDLVKVLSWYDNEAGYVSTLVKHVLQAVKHS
jgi:glyceraldehyde 3-phosphate dehydrogenase